MKATLNIEFDNTQELQDVLHLLSHHIPTENHQVIIEEVKDKGDSEKIAILSPSILKEDTKEKKPVLHKKTKIYDRICKHCQKPFTTKSDKRSTCSKHCYMQIYWKTYKVPVKTVYTVPISTQTTPSPSEKETKLKATLAKLKAENPTPIQRKDSSRQLW
jgi:hypothetical protein